jgi:mono/diheme cytochrome c family protein
MKRFGFLAGIAVVIGGLGTAMGQPQPAQGQPTVVSPPVRIQPPQALPQPPVENFLAFDAQQKEVSVTNGMPEANFVFNLTNISSGEVIVNWVQTSCGCTVAKLPSTPWKLAPKESGQISATMKLAGTAVGGTKTKALTVSTDKGNKVLIVKATILPGAPGPMTEADRMSAQKIAIANRQAVFTDPSCIQCHAATAKDAAGHDKVGKDLFAAVCDVCHESEHQASFVPKLAHLKEPTSAEFWKNWVMHGKPGTLMPAFAKSEGGILSDAQVDSLVAYLTVTIPSKAAAQNTVPAKTVVQ